MRTTKSLPATRTLNRVKFLVAVALVLMVGCSSSEPVGSLEGKVTFNGKPIANAKIQLQSSTTGRAAAADVDADGNFELADGLATGQYDVSITPNSDAPLAGEEGDGSPPPRRPDIPTKYREIATSGLTMTITEGDNTLDVTMTSE